MGRGGAAFGRISSMTMKGPYAENEEVKLQYPRNSRLLLGTLANVKQPGFLKALQTEYPVELSIECVNIVGARARGLLGRRARFPTDVRPFAVFFFKAGGADRPWQIIGRTETVLYDESARFVVKIKLACPTPEDRAKEFRIELFNRITVSPDLHEQQFLGAIESSIDAVVAEPLFRKEIAVQKSRDLDSCSIIVSADIIRPSLVPTRAIIDVHFSSITKGATRVFYVISRQLPSGDFTPVYRSEVLEPDEKRFASMERRVDALTAGVDEKLLRIELYQLVDRRSRCLKLGYLQTSLKKMMDMDWNSSLLWWPAANETKHPEFVEIGRVVLLENDKSDSSNRFLLRVTQ